jgi:hypothetical protein
MEVELSEEYEVRRGAVAELVRAVLARFALNEAAPRFGTRIDVRRWWRLGQEDFAGLQRDAWVMPKDLPILGWLDGFPEIAAVRQAYAADPVLRDRVDTMLGAPFNLCGTNFYWILAQHVIEPLVSATRSYQFDQEAFERSYLNFESRFRATHLHMVEFRVLNGFDAVASRIELPDALVLQRMTDSQISEAILRNAVPRMDGGGVNNARVHRYDQWALTLMTKFPVVAGD